MNLDTLLTAWYQHAHERLPEGVPVWDAHTHTGDRDPDGVVGRVEELLEALLHAGHAGAVVASNHNPDGYREANDRILAEADAADGRLAPFLRVAPSDPESVAEVERSLTAGHRGIKLHPRAEAFDLAHSSLIPIARLAAAAGAPLLFHAGRGIPSLGDGALQLVDRVEGLNVILAHCAISDLAYLGPIAADHPGIFFDTSWWNVTDIIALMSWVPPERIVYASDTPYGDPLMSFIITMRPALAAGYTPAQLTALFSTTITGLLAGERPAAMSPPPGDDFFSHTAGLLRVHSNLHGSVVRIFSDQDPSQPLSLARLACNVRDGANHREVYRAIATTLDAITPHIDDPDRRRVVVGLLLACTAVALTPDVGVPDL
ncbi:MAG: amidohydrolase family protein [Acidimicrobiia bacterium]|nr:amidohydrolase family protein [Acidimicrobiia bacterium]NNL69267.1 amidohydrolase family protein [Acidimicrobiia bacterium]